MKEPENQQLQKAVISINGLHKSFGDLKVGSPDTLARVYALTKQTAELDFLKKNLSCFLIYEQLEKYRDINAYNKLSKEEKEFQDSINEILDRRYISFFATIMGFDKNNNPVLPENVNVVSWNYDNQVERAFQEFCIRSESLFEVQDSLSAFPRIKRIVSDKVSDRKLLERFNLIKLNGTGTFTDEEENGELFEFKKHVANSDSFGIMNNILFSRRSNYYNRLYFAWEDTVKFREK